MKKNAFLNYENGVVLMMFFLFGFVFMERLSIVFLFPFIAPDMGLTNADLGVIVAVLSITWALSGWIFSSLSDLIGSKRKVLLPATLAFSICSFLSGIATTFLAMILVRAVMGLAEGPVQPIAQSAILSESTPKRRGFNSGFMQSSLGLLGATLTPIIVTAYAAKYSWHGAFYLVGVPGLIMFFVLAKYMREPKKVVEDKKEPVKATRKDYLQVYKNRNTLLCTLISAVFMTWLFVFMAAVGFGSFIWGFVGPGISDKIGRKPTLIIFSFIACLAPLVLALVHGSVGLMMILGFFTAVGQACFPLFMAIIPGESIKAGLIASAISVTQLIGELVGGCVAPVLAGVAADAWGLEAPLYIACAGAIIGGIIAFGLKETAPIKLKRNELVSIGNSVGS